MLKDSIERYRKFNLLSTNELIKNEKFKVILDPEAEEVKEVEVSLSQIDEILEENRKWLW